LKKKKYIFYILMIIAVILLSIIFSSQTYLITVINFIGIYAIAASGLDLLFGYSGQISLGHAGFYAIGAYTSAILSMQTGIPVILSMFIGAVFVTLIGIVLAYPAAKLKHHFLALTTIAFGEIVYLLIIYSPGDITQGFSGIAMIPSLELFGLSFNTPQSFFYVTLFFLIVFLVVKALIVNSRIGRAFIAIRDNSLAANGMGINVSKYKIMAFAISAFFTGFAGAMYTHMVRFISPETFTMDSLSVVLLTVVLFGGLASQWGPVIGAIVVTLIKEILQVTGVYQMIIYGAFIVIVLLFMPRGIVSFFFDLKKNMKSKVVQIDAES
jgi:branched-chain amino acid transport system permease protein